MKVKCAECGNQDKGICNFTKSTVRLNKRRTCDKFELDEDKVKKKTPIPTTKRPDWWHHREELRRDHKKKLKELKNKTEETKIDGKYMPDANPTTGNLDRFIRSTASREKG